MIVTKKLKMKLSLLITLLVLLLLITGCASDDSSIDEDVNNFQVERVAHAGGGFEGLTYTNSFEALDYNMGKGFTYFEIDFEFTRDNELVCMHDWTGSFSKAFSFWQEEIPTLEEFENLVKNNSKYHICTIYTLKSWLEQNPHTYIITDVKQDNLKALDIISGMISNYETRIIPQIYYPLNFNVVKEMGYENIIWTLYKYPSSDEEILFWAKNFTGSFAITMGHGRPSPELLKNLSDLRVPTYIHTINSLELYDAYKSQGASEIYTDFLHPGITNS